VIRGLRIEEVVYVIFAGLSAQGDAIATNKGHSIWIYRGRQPNRSCHKGSLATKGKDYHRVTNNLEVKKKSERRVIHAMTELRASDFDSRISVRMQLSPESHSGVKGVSS
jgi:hypothetical protein